MREKTELRYRVPVKDSLFPMSIFFIYLIVMLFMSGIHTGLLVLANAFHWNEIIQTVIPIVYWSAVAAGLTFFTRREIQKS